MHDYIFRTGTTKIISIAQITWGEHMVYRLNFIMWRLRMVVHMLVMYFLWLVITASHENLFGYTARSMLTYVILSSFIRTLVMSTKTHEIGSVIHRGDLSNILLRPFGFFSWYAGKDLGDKALNTTFSFFEILILLMLLSPPVFIQHSVLYILCSLCAVIFGMILYFLFSMLVGFLGFWTPDVWAPRFISFVIIDFFAGGFFPLDILPRPLFAISQALPFGYMIYFPLRVYLGNISIHQLVAGFVICMAWIAIFLAGNAWVYRKGLSVYTATGR